MAQRTVYGLHTAEEAATILEVYRQTYPGVRFLMLRGRQAWMGWRAWWRGEKHYIYIVSAFAHPAVLDHVTRKEGWDG